MLIPILERDVGFGIRFMTTVVGNFAYVVSVCELDCNYLGGDAV